jgi:hypothetical protein
LSRPRDRVPAAMPVTLLLPTVPPLGIGRVSCLKAWMSMWSLEASNCQGPPQLAKLALPSLVVQSVADMGVFPSDARKIHESLGSADKTLEMIPGAHYFEDAEENRTRAIDLMAAWIVAYG